MGSTAAKLRFVLASPDAPSVKILVDGSSVAAKYVVRQQYPIHFGETWTSAHSGGAGQ
jgi:hypothetical protein